MTQWTFGEYCFELVADGQVAGRVEVLIHRGGEPFLDMHGAPLRKIFPAKASLARIEQFCRRFATDDAYRTGTILKHAFACC
ncbi:MAG: hypothetical protein KKF77_14550 [Proteobacteria bacterium]|nr:hypothetical protein [Pseudomonadota bacterium]